jgi:mannose-1-phosphate guanylyltransferase
VLDLIPRGAPSDIVRDVYFGLAAEGRLNAHVHGGFWWEFGSPREYLEGSIELVGLPSEKRLGLGDFDTVRPVGGAIASVGAGADLSAPGIQLAGTLAIGMGVMVGEGTTLEDTVVMPGAWIGPGSNLRRCIVAPGTEIPLEFSASDALLAPDVDRDSAPARGIERVSGLLIRRFSSAPAS